MPKFRKKPIEIEARQFDGEIRPHHPISEWIREGGGKAAYSPGNPVYPQQLLIVTLEGEMVVSRGDWVIRGVQGEFYPCKPDIFSATYDEVE